MRYDISYSSVSIIELCFEAPYVPLRGDSIFRNITSYFLILFMFLFFFLFVLQRSRIHHSSSKIVQEIKRKKTHCCVHSVRWVPTPPQCHGNPPATPPVLPILGVTVAPMQPRFDADETTKQKHIEYHGASSTAREVFYRINWWSSMFCAKLKQQLGELAEETTKKTYRLPRCIINSTRSVYRINDHWTSMFCEKLKQKLPRCITNSTRSVYRINWWRTLRSCTGRTFPCSIHMHRKIPRVSWRMSWSCFATAYARWVEAVLTRESTDVWRVWFCIAAAA